MSAAAEPPAPPPQPLPIRVWVVEDGALLRRSLAAYLAAAPQLACPRAFGSVEELAAALAAGDRPDVVLMDLALPGRSGVEGTRLLRAAVPSARILVLTVQEDDDSVFAAICAGASGYLLKPTPLAHVAEAVRRVAAGEAAMDGVVARRVLEQFARVASLPRRGAGDTRPRLTEREREILALLVDGLAMKQIAARLGVSYHTVDAHLRNVYEKLHVHSRSAAVVKAVKEGLL